jgi:hypothetical protein
VGSGAFLIMFAVAVVVLAAVVCLWAVRRNRAITFDKVRYPGLATLRRSTTTARYVGLAAAFAVFVLVSLAGRLNWGLFLAPQAAGAVLVLAVMVGQQVAYGKARTAGVAAIERRLVRRYLPRGLSVAVGVFLVVLIGLATWTTLAASQDSLGLYRAFSVIGTDTVMMDGNPEVVLAGSTRSPFPGGFYTMRLAVGLPVLLVLGALALWLTARRPRNGADETLVAVDDALRRQTAEGIVAAMGLAVSLSLFGVALGAASAVGGMAEFGAWYVVGAVVLGIVALASLLVAAWCTVLVLVPGGETVKPA